MCEGRYVGDDGGQGGYTGTQEQGSCSRDADSPHEIGDTTTGTSTTTVTANTSTGTGTSTSNTSPLGLQRQRRQDIPHESLQHHQRPRPDDPAHRSAGEERGALQPQELRVHLTVGVQLCVCCEGKVKQVRVS